MAWFRRSAGIGLLALLAAGVLWLFSRQTTPADAFIAAQCRRFYAHARTAVDTGVADAQIVSGSGGPPGPTSLSCGTLRQLERPRVSPKR